VSSDVATLAQRFAQALEHLRAAHDLQYVSARPLPEAAPVEEEAAAVGSTSEAAEEDVAATAEAIEPPRAAVSSAPPPSESPARTAAATAAPPPSEPPVRTSAPPPSESPARTSAASPEPPAASTPPAHTTASAASPSPEPSSDRDEARRSLREQAQSWTPAKKLEYLRVHNVGDCQRCPLARTRNHIVFGVGNPHAEIMFIGEAPGADEDRQGEPFVGRAGQLLNQWLSQLGLARQDVYIANVLKCRPPGNRDPRPEEVDRCSPFLQAQIRAIEPKVIVALGRHAGMLLSRREELTLRAMRQSRLSYDAGAAKGGATQGAAQGAASRVMIPLVVTYHPAYVLRQEGEGRSAAPGQPSATELVMTDLRRALAIARGG